MSGDSVGGYRCIALDLRRGALLCLNVVSTTKTISGGLSELTLCLVLRKLWDLRRKSITHTHCRDQVAGHRCIRFNLFAQIRHVYANVMRVFNV